ncbi:MAG: hypothetical protein IJ523_09895, partial [Succinivibrionaceae bacterium]|nr:hypothetical protein [Succinivibrionaceae bacterium]
MAIIRHRHLRQGIIMTVRDIIIMVQAPVHVLAVLIIGTAQAQVLVLAVMAQAPAHAQADTVLAPV